MSLNRALLCAVSGVLVFIPGFSSGGKSGDAVPAAQSGDAEAGADQEVLKINAECNAAELRGDVAVMDNCETDDFTHTHANGTVEHKTAYLKGVVYAVAFAAIFVLVPFHFIVTMQRELQGGRHRPAFDLLSGSRFGTIAPRAIRGFLERLSSALIRSV